MGHIMTLYSFTLLKLERFGVVYSHISVWFTPISPDGLCQLFLQLSSPRIGITIAIYTHKGIL